MSQFGNLKMKDVLQIELIQRIMHFELLIMNLKQYLCTRIGLLLSTSEKAIKRECRENRQQSRCCKLHFELTVDN
jgi:hypothetical protein